MLHQCGALHARLSASLTERRPRLLGHAAQHRFRRTTGVIARGSKRSVPLTVEISRKVAFGESLKAVGNAPTLGDWAVDKALDLQWQDGDVWQCTFQVPVGHPLRFKLVAVSKDGVAWEDGDDRQLTALGPDYGLRAVCKWNDTKGTSIESFKLELAGAGAGGKASQPSHPQANNNRNSHGSNNGSSNNGSSNGAAFRAVMDAPAPSPTELDQQASGGRAWVGAEPEFVQSRLNAARRGTWDKAGLTGVELDLVKGDEKAANWLSKLDVIKELIVDRSPKMRPGTEEMASCYVYATWINTGAIMCAEAGGHHRPNHHANLALQMFRSLEWVIGDNSALYSPKGVAADPLSVMAARRMHNRLPSISGEFRQSVPLTRIRDIAHRGDIPRDIKNEIKHTLQNKLHRSAGPEDLIASEVMLKRITANPGEFSQPFVEEFKIFMKELREFFNASGLEELLAKTQGSLDDAHNSALTQMLASKRKVEAAGDRPPLEDLMTLLFSSTQLRTFYAAGLSAGLRNDVDDNSLEMRQRWRLSEIRLEEYCFVVLSRIVNVIEEQGGPAALSKAPNSAWALPLSALTAGLRNLGLSQFKAQELLALENELQAWHSLAPLVQGGRDNALRAKASLDRVVRLAAEYSDLLMNVYSKPAADLGRGLGVPQYMASIFGESEVRSSVAFQVSKLASLMSKALRMAAGQSAWDGLVTGTAVGVLREVDSLSPNVVEELVKGGKGTDLVLVVRAASGDEELGPLVPLGLRGVVLRQELPHLSHLGVRARQEKVTFATVDDEELYGSAVKPLLGKRVCLDVSPTAVTLQEDRGGSSKVLGERAPAAERPVASTSGWGAGKRVSTPTLIPLAKATGELCGAKAAKCADLERLAVGAKHMFRTPIGCCLPFGTMDLALQQAGKATAAEFKSILDSMEKPELTGDALDEACSRMQALVGKLPLPGKLLDQVRGVFSSSSLLAVRSSANVEDLAGMSAAGLYESVVGVAASDPDAVARAVGAVWASLYTRRAVLSRRAAGVPQSAATMCVLIMELYGPKVSFVLHTARPSDGNDNIVLVEAAPGQGETLAAATQGTPWRWEVNKTSGAVDAHAFANFSRALVVAPAKAEGLVEVEVDYSKQRLSVDAEYRTQIAQRLAAVGSTIEAFYDKMPQDIEGGLVAHDAAGSGKQEVDVFIFQTRPQH